MRHSAVWAALAGLIGLLGGCSQQIDFQGIIAVAKGKVYPSLVFVKPIQEMFRSGERTRAEVFGSGVIISSDGYVVTNNHVAEKAIEINCVLGDREQVPATVVGLDPETDLALLKLRLPEGHPPLPVASFGDSDKVEPGQFVMALGSPFGFTRSISLGIISNTQRYLGFETSHQYNLWLQTDAAINPGNSGGPLVDTRGEIIGINTLGTWAEGIGFAIPSNVVKDVVARLIEQAGKTSEDRWPVKVARAHVGLQLQALRDFNTNTFTDAQRGVLVQSVDQDSPADQAGIRGGDILLAVEGLPLDGLYVEDLPRIRLVLADLPTDRPCRFLVARDKGPATQPSQPARLADGSAPQPSDVGGRAIRELTLVPVARGKFEGEDLDCRRWNMTLKEITKYSNPELYFLQPGGGVFIQGVREEGNAADAGLAPGDIILKIGPYPVKTVADAQKAYEALIGDKARTDKRVLVTIKRGAFQHWKTLSWHKDYLQED